MDSARMHFPGFGLRFIEYARGIQVADRCAARDGGVKSGVFPDRCLKAYPDFRCTLPFPLIGRSIGHAGRS